MIPPFSHVFTHVQRSAELQKFYKEFLQSKPLYLNIQRALSELVKAEMQGEDPVTPVSMSPILGKRL